MQIRINGGSERQRILVREMTKWACHKFFNKNTYRQLKLSVKIKPPFDDYFVGETWNDKGISSPKIFTIIISKDLNNFFFKTTFLHELVHIKQYAKNELYDYNVIGDERKHVRFKDKIYEDKMDENETELEYLYQPWEVEARGMEEALMIEFNQYMKGRKKK